MTGTTEEWKQYRAGYEAAKALLKKHPDVNRAMQVSDRPKGQQSWYDRGYTFAFDYRDKQLAARKPYDD